MRPQAAHCNPIHSPRRNLDPNPKPESKQEQSRELKIDNRVVTVDALRTRLESITRLVVAPRAIVTPAVHDLLRDKKITLHRGPAVATETNKTAAVDPDVVIALCDAKQASVSYEKAAPASLTCRTLTAKTMACGVREVATEVTRHSCLGVIVTSDPFSAACLANRQKGVRAAQATSTEGD